MTGPAFTPGPWTVSENNHLEGGIYNPASGSKVYIADIKTHRPGSADRVPQEAEQKSNARLIAAAPELYVALAAMVKEFHGYEHDDGASRSAVTALKAAMAALAKIEGRVS